MTLAPTDWALEYSDINSVYTLSFEASQRNRALIFVYLRWMGMVRTRVMSFKMRGRDDL